MIYFGTDGIRGVAVTDLTQEVCFKCGNALASLKNNAKIVVGTDTRTSGGFIFSSFASGATLAGADIFFVGVIPTPAISYLAKKHKADFGVIITASHNPAEYNGIKIFDANGEKIGGDLQIEIEKRFAKQKIAAPEQVGKICFRQKYTEEYVDFVCSTSIDLSGLKIVLDSANGASGVAAAKIFKKLGAEVVKTNCSKNGELINKNCGALFPQKLAEVVLQSKADCGFAFDGDADRVVLVDETGKIANGDQIVLFFAKMFKKFGLLKTGAVVGTIQTNIGIERELEALGLKLLRTDVGDQFVCAELKKRSLQIGGEQAGHVILFDLLCTGDGILNAVQICKFLKLSGGKISEYIFDDLTPQHSIDVFAQNKFEIVNSAKFRVAVSECEKLFGAEGRIVARASGTEPKIRIMVESKNHELAQKILAKLCDAAKQ